MYKSLHECWISDIKKYIIIFDLSYITVENFIKNNYYILDLFQN